MSKKFRAALLMSALLALFVVGVAFAWVITVDGNPSEWDLNSLESDDGIDPDAPEYGVDIDYYWATNDGYNIYYRVDTWANTNWENIQSFAVCMDVTSATNSGCGPTWGCDGDADYALVIDPLFGSTDLIDASTCANVPGAFPTSASLANITEVSVPVAALGLNSTNCAPCWVGTQMILQYGPDLADADLFPNAGDGYWPQIIGEGATSVGLASFSASPAASGGPLNLAQGITLAASILMLALVIAWRRALTFPK